ncbi:phosphatase PAP2 family protein [Acinetobacter lactucae]|uniref:phosphatase PAP2 family protein n=1 Tax=Acinetobacter lactucae TaxID=1785128 RepID=UPI001581146A|nr:phosphatase PAP2 family protein [Acinetobacter lactucae]NUF38211.1 phosphatase PAP2 family protein [Acinetobacter lactucae]
MLHGMNQQKQFFQLNIILLFFSFFLLLIVFPVGGKIDMYFIHPWIDSTGHFFNRDNWYLERLNHEIVKQIITTVYIIFFGLWLASFKVKKLKLYRWQYGYMFFVSMIGSGIVGLLKSQSAHACPWNMVHPTTLSYVWDFTATHGHCFPGGHASAGFILMTGYFVYRLEQPKRAYFYLISGILLGFMMGWAQMMRGAHFLSHNLWTGWVIWAVNILFYAFCIHRFEFEKRIKQELA